MKRFIILLAMILGVFNIYAYDFVVANNHGKKICYNITSSTTCEVTIADLDSTDRNLYSGYIDIPSTVKNPKTNKTYEVTKIGKEAFCRSDITAVTIPHSIKSIGEDSFYSSDITLIIIPNSVTSIDNRAFAFCYNLESITIPNSVTSIGSLAFAFSKISSIKIPDSVTRVGYGAFKDCKYLEQATISNKVTEINNYMFYNCRSLVSVTMPNSVTSIGDYAFQDCKKLSKVTIPDSVTSIGNYAFNGCESLVSLSIPSMVSIIGENSFSGCLGLTSITVAASNYNYDSRDNCNAIIETSTNSLIFGCANSHIPNTVDSIGNFAFEKQLRLISVIIPYSIKSIGVCSFFCCDNLSSVKVENTNPPHLANNAFPYANQNSITLEVPEGSLSAYQIADGWRRFNIIEYKQNSSSIETIETHNHPDGVIYSIEGKQLGTIPSKGIYIWNGHKILHH